MPYPPRVDPTYHMDEHQPSVKSITAGGDQAEHQRHQEFVPLVLAETEGLQQEEYRPDDDPIDDAFAYQQPATPLSERVFAIDECHASYMLSEMFVFRMQSYEDFWKYRMSNRK